MSRYPVFGRGGYDESLLQMAPEVTKADRQQGYSVDILEQGRQSNFHGPRFGPGPRRPQQFTQGYEQPGFQQSTSYHPNNYSSPPSLEKVDYYSSMDRRDIYTIRSYKPPKKPWYRTKRGLAIIFVIVILVAGATVGIAVGISSRVNKANANNKGAQEGAQNGSKSPSSGPTGAGGGGGAASTKALPSLPTLETLHLSSTNPAATSTSPTITLLNPNGASTANAVVQTRPAATKSAPATRTSLATKEVTLDVDPICQRFPNLPACGER